jgi:type III secretion protein T
LIQPLNDAISSIALSLPRILTCFLIVPVLSGRQLQGMMRIAVGVGIAAPVAVGIFYQHEVVDLSAMQMFGLFIKESLIGLLIGFLLATPFWIFESIGTLFDTQRGALMGQQLNPETGSMSSVTGTLLMQSAIVLMIELGAFAWLFGLLMDSYVVWPALAWLPDFTPDAQGLIIAEFVFMAKMFVLYSLPLVLVLVFIEFVFALVGVYSPQLQVYFLAMPAKSLAGFIVLILYAGMLWQYGGDLFLRAKEQGAVLQTILPAFVSKD